MNDPTEQIRLLQTQVLSLETEIKRMQAFEEAHRQRVWLGRVADLFDEITCNYVFREEYDTVCIGDIQRSDECEHLKNEHSRNFDYFKRFLLAKGFGVYDIIELSRELRAVRSSIDGLTNGPDEAEKVTQQNLEEWTHHLRPDIIQGAKSLIGIVAEFAVDGRVLDNAGNALSVVQGFLRKLDESEEAKRLVRLFTPYAQVEPAP